MVAARPVDAGRELAAEVLELAYRRGDRAQGVLTGPDGFPAEISRVAGRPDRDVDGERVGGGAQGLDRSGGVHEDVSVSWRVRVIRWPRPVSEVIVIAARCNTRKTAAGLSPPVTRSRKMIVLMRSGARPARVTRTVPG